jgi:cell filamentation protein
VAGTYKTGADYLYANGTLRNRPGIRDRRKLATFERAISRYRQTEIERGLVDIPRTYDAEHLSKIHRHLFGDVYEWAGQQRAVDIFKRSDPHPFAQVERTPVNHIDQAQAEATTRLSRAPWAQANQAMFSHYMAEAFAWLNYAHPFREGNGRATRLFLEHVSERTPFTLDYALVTPQTWKERSAATMPPPGSQDPDPQPMVDVFYSIASPRARSEAEDVNRLRELHRMSFPTRPSAVPAVGPRGGSPPAARVQSRAAGADVTDSVER